MRIPDQTIDEIRSANDIVDVVSAHVSLKRRGKNYTGLCPFHREKTPSFTVSPDKQMYHCFGCGKGGNVFTFVMETERVSFVEAVRSLAERVGITIAETSDDGQRGEIEHLYDACKFAGLQFYKTLTESGEGKAALEYFHARGFSDETIRLFGLGYSLNSWDGLLKAASEQAIPSDHLVKAGLLRARDDGSGFYDYFRGRAMFPIFSTSGRVIAFGARKMRDDDPIQGKYINSPETPIYSKSKMLYGLYHSKEAIRSEGSVLMVEGYADLISLFQAGIQNVVASSGTALTEEQVRLVGKYSKTMALVYDADSAGSKAMVRGLDIALGQGLDVKVVELPQGEDPDSFVRKQGAKEFRSLVARAVSFIDFKASRFQQAGELNTPEGQARAVRSIIQSIARIGDELKRNFFIKEVSEKYEIYESVLFRELEKWLKNPTSGREREDEQGNRVSALPNAPQTQGFRRDIPAAERDLLKVLFEGVPEIVEFVLTNVSLDDFSDHRLKTLAQQAGARFKDVGTLEVSSFINELKEEELKSLVADIVLSKYEISKGWHDLAVEIDEPDPAEIARAAVAAIRRQAVQKEVEQNQRQLKEASQRGEEVLPFVKRHQELLQILKQFDTPPPTQTN